MELHGVQGKNISLDDVLVMMDIFAMPYKACVLRLYECGVIGESKTRELCDKSWKEVQDRIFLTGKAKRWQLDGVWYAMPLSDFGSFAMTIPILLWYLKGLKSKNL